MAPPKSLDRNSFAAITMDALSPGDGAATLVEIIARAIAKAKAGCRKHQRHGSFAAVVGTTPSIMNALRNRLPNVQAAEAYGFNGDSIEAEAWAYMAVRSQKKLPLSFPMTTKVSEPMTGGVLALP